MIFGKYHSVRNISLELNYPFRAIHCTSNNKVHTNLALS